MDMKIDMEQEVLPDPEAAEGMDMGEILQAVIPGQGAREEEVLRALLPIKGAAVQAEVRFKGHEVGIVGEMGRGIGELRIIIR